MGKAEKEKMKQQRKKQSEKKKKAVSAKEYTRARKQKTSKYVLHAMFIVLAELLVGIAVYFLTDFENQNIYLAMLGVMLLLPMLYYRVRVIGDYGVKKNDILVDGAFTVVWGGALFAVYGNHFTVYALTAPLLIITLVSAAAYLMQSKKN